MRIALAGLGLVSLGWAGGCWLPTPSDWSGGYEGVYQGSGDYIMKAKYEDGSTSTVKGTSLTSAELVPASNPFGTHLFRGVGGSTFFGGGPCGGLPVRTSPLGFIPVTPLPTCETTSSTSSDRTEVSTEVTDATVKNGLGTTGEINVHLEWTEKSRRTTNSGGSTSTTTSTVTFDFTGKKL